MADIISDPKEVGEFSKTGGNSAGLTGAAN
jgi:hypothetical protein